MSRSKHPVKDREVERLAREALTIHFQMRGPLTADAVNTAMGLYARTFGPGAALAFTNRVNRELMEESWGNSPTVSA